MEERPEGTREGKEMWKKKQKGTSSGPPLVSLLRVGNEAGDSGRSAWTPFSCGSAPLPATCGCICCCNKPSLPAPGAVCFPRANPATGWVEEGETQPLGTQAGTRGSQGCLQRLRQLGLCSKPQRAGNTMGRRASAFRRAQAVPSTRRASSHAWSTNSQPRGARGFLPKKIYSV